MKGNVYKWDMEKCVKYKQSQSVKTNCFRNIIKIRGLFIDYDYKLVKKGYVKGEVAIQCIKNLSI